MNKDKTILIVDDLEENRYFLESLFQGKGYAIDTAIHGKDALKKLKKHKFDIIISDILMPEMDGFQFCRACKTSKELQSIPLIFVTATYTEKSDEDFALDLGAEDLISKPIDQEMLLEKVKKILKNYKFVEKDSVHLPTEKDEIQHLKQYSQRVAKKLEQTIHKLNAQYVQLEQKNAALKEILSQVEEEKKHIREDVIANVDSVLMPNVEKLRMKGAAKKYLDIITNNLNELSSSYGKRITMESVKLTKREIEICDLIKNGLPNKEISKLLNLSPATVEKHRHHIRSKFALLKKGDNLTTYLKTL